MSAIKLNIKLPSNTYWCLRQNPYAKTDQNDMYNYITQTNYITAPFGHINEYKDNVVNLTYNNSHPKWASMGQDKLFMEEMKVGDIVFIPLKQDSRVIVCKITGGTTVDRDSKYKITEVNKQYKLNQTEMDGKVFEPIVRPIKVIKVLMKGTEITDMRCFPMNSLTKLSDTDKWKKLIE